MVKTPEKPVSNELILKMGYVAKDILSRVTLSPEASYRIINIPRKLLTAEFLACHMVEVIQDELGIPMSEIIKTAETGEKTPLLIRKIRMQQQAERDHHGRKKNHQRNGETEK